MKKHKFKDGDGVLSTNTTREQRAEILKYAYENGYKVYNMTWCLKEGFMSFDETIYFDGEYFMGCGNSEVTNLMSYEEIMTKINPEWLVGKKCRGFEFRHHNSGIFYAEEMDAFIGKIGKIIEVTENLYIRIRFDKKGTWIYPLSEVHKHLVLEEESKPYIPEKYEKALFWDDDEKDIVEAEFLCYNEKSNEFPYVTVSKEQTIPYTNCKPLTKEEPKQEKFLWQVQDTYNRWVLHSYYLTEDESKEYLDSAHKAYRKVESVEQLFKIVE